MKTILLAAATLALVPVNAQAQLLGGGGLGGTLGGSLGGNLGSGLERPVGGTLDRTTRTVRSAVDADGSTNGTQSVDARRGTVAAERSANGSIMASTASLAEIVVPHSSQMTQASGQGAASGQGSASAQLIGTDAVTGSVAPIAQRTRARAGEAVSSVREAAVAGDTMAAASGAGATNGSLFASPLAVAGSAAADAQGAAPVRRGMPVMLADGSSLGRVKQIIANGRGEVDQVVVKQGNVTRALPAGMFSASGDALLLTHASGTTAPPDAGEPAE